MTTSLRVAVVSESFLPSLNGVTTSVRHVLEHLRERGHEAVLVAPRPAPARYAGFEVVSVRAVNYRQFPVGLPTRAVTKTLAAFQPDVVHVASPFVLGAAGLFAARRLGLPSVAIFQTDVAGFAQRHHLGPAASTAWRWIRRMHSAADVTLAPTSVCADDLRTHGVPRVQVWGRGVDHSLFHPQRRMTASVQRLRETLADPGEVIVGYVGRLAPEKRVERLAALHGMPGVRVAVVGDGPSAAVVARRLPEATLLGRLEGDALADAYAAFDLFAHTGTEETFGQTLQEAMATGLPVVAPASGGPLDLVTHGERGLLYSPHDDDALRAAVARLAADPALRSAMGAAGRAFVEPRSWASLGDRLIGYYRSAISSRSTEALRLAA